MTEPEKHFSEFLKEFTERSRVHHERLRKEILMEKIEEINNLDATINSRLEKIKLKQLEQQND